MKRTLRGLCLAISLGLPVMTLGLTGCAGDRYERSTGEYIDDKAISARVNRALSDNPDYKFHDVQVTSFKGKVQLSGFVRTGEQKSAAEQIAERTPGVKEVENRITLKD